jgi:deoxyribose-phosphate aldolase
MDTGIAYIKTSTGWYGGATVADIELIKSVTKGRIGIKASGGISTYQQAVDLIVAGATRLGTSRAVDILKTETKKES